MKPIFQCRSPTIASLGMLCAISINHSEVRKMKNKILLALLILVAPSVAMANTFQIKVVDGFLSQDAGEFDSPELEAATLDWLNRLNRVTYSPNPIRINLADIAFTDGTLGRAGRSFQGSNSNDEITESVGLSAEYSHTYPVLIARGAPYRSESSLDEGDIYISSVEDWDTTVDIDNPSNLYEVLTHELVHALGFGSNLQRGDSAVDGSWCCGGHQRPGSFDSFIYSSGERLADMETNEERNEVFSNQDNVVFSGSITNLYAADIVSFGGGADGVQLQASATYEEVTLSHFAYAVEPNMLMEPSGYAEDFFVSFAVLADLGYGDMLDTQVRVHSSDNDSLILAVSSETLQDRASIDSVVLTVPLVEGLALTPTTGDMSCTETEVAWVCALPELTTNTDHLFGFDVTAEDGDYTMQIDVEHQAAHVDAAPLNNFENVTITIDTSPAPTPTPTPTTPPSSGGGGGCTVVKGGSDSSLPVLLLSAFLLLARRRFQY
jgi:hypothetical protein